MTREVNSEKILWYAYNFSETKRQLCMCVRDNAVIRAQIGFYTRIYISVENQNITYTVM